MSFVDIVLAIDFASDSISWLLELRRVSKEYRDAIDNHSEPTWFRLLKVRDIKFTLRMRIPYMIRTIIRSISWYKRNRDGLTYIPDPSTYNGERLSNDFISNTTPHIDNIYIQNGCVNWIGTISSTKQTALINACLTKNTTRISYLLNNGADPNLRTTDNLEPLRCLLSVLKGEEVNSAPIAVIIRLFIAKGVDTTISLYSTKITLTIMGMLVEEGRADVNHIHPTEGTPLHYVSRKIANISLIEYLGQRCNKSAIDNAGNNALVSCCLSPEVIVDNAVVLIGMGLKFGTTAKRREVLNHLLKDKKNQHLPIIKVVLHDESVESGPTSFLNITYVDSNDETLFMRDLRVEVLVELLRHLDKTGDESAKLFLLNMLSNRDETALLKAYERRDMEAMKLLIDAGVDSSALFNTIMRDKNDNHIDVKLEVIDYLCKKQKPGTPISEQQGSLRYYLWCEYHKTFFLTLVAVLFFTIIFFILFIIYRVGSYCVSRS